MRTSTVRERESSAAGSAVAVICRAMITHQVRELQSRIFPGRVPAAVRWGATLLVVGATTAFSVQCWVLGSQLYASGVAFSTISVLVSLAATTATLAVIAKGGQSTGAVTWATHALAPLPLSRARLTALAHLAWLWPGAVIAALAAAPAAAFGLGIEAGPADVIEPAAIGVLVVIMPLLLLLIAARSFCPARLRARATLPLGFVGATLAYGHAGWFIGQVDQSVSGPHALSPVVHLLVAGGPVPWPRAAGWALAVVVATGAFALAMRDNRHQAAPTRASRRAPTSTRPLPLVNVLLLLTRRPSSIRTETLTMMLAVAVGGWVVGLLHANGRAEHAQVIVTWLGLLASIPLLSLRSGLGPTQRLIQCGVHPRHLATACTTAGLLLIAPTLLTGVASLGVFGVGPDAMARLVLGGLVGACLAMVLSHVARELTRLGLGRIGVSWLLLLLFAGLSRLGLTRWAAVPDLLLTCAAAAAALALALWLTVRVTTLDTTSEDS